jgi:hypothetical protein
MIFGKDTVRNGAVHSDQLAASSDGVQNVKSQRLFSMDEITAIRKKRVELQASLHAARSLSGNQNTSSLLVN